MSSLQTIQVGIPEVPPAAAIVRELALTAGRYSSAGKQNACIAIIARIYDLLDDFDQTVVLR